MPADSSILRLLVGLNLTPTEKSFALILVSDEPVKSKLFRFPIRLEALSFLRVISAVVKRLKCFC